MFVHLLRDQMFMLYHGIDQGKELVHNIHGVYTRTRTSSDSYCRAIRIRAFRTGKSVRTPYMYKSGIFARMPAIHAGQRDFSQPMEDLRSLFTAINEMYGIVTIFSLPFYNSINSSIIPSTSLRYDPIGIIKVSKESQE